MKIIVNSKLLKVNGTTLFSVLQELNFDAPSVATALNGNFVPKAMRETTTLKDGDQLEVLAPMQGG